MEAAIGIALIVIAALEIALIVRIVSANMPAAAYTEPLPPPDRG